MTRLLCWIVGHRWEDFVFPDERDNVVARRAELMASGTVRVPERHLIRGDGARVPAEVSASLVRVGDEAVALFILRDISERRRSERELRAVQERLQHVVASSPAFATPIQS